MEAMVIAAALGLAAGAAGGWVLAAKKAPDDKPPELPPEESPESDKLDAAEARLHGIVNTVRDAIVVFDEAGEITFANPIAEQLFGYSKQGLRGISINKIVPREMAIWPKLSAESQGPLSGSLLDTTGQMDSGKELPLEVNLGVLEEGDERSYVAAFRDVSDRRKREESTQRALDEAAAANNAKSEFLASMSHEIRTPMNAVIGMAGLLLETPLSEEQRNYARVIRTSGDALLMVINDILDFSKIEAGKIELEEIPFDVDECLEDSLDLVGIKAAEKGIDIAYLPALGIGRYYRADSTRIRQILVNLLSNAVKFTEKGEVIAEVRAEPSDDQSGGVQLQFTVRDTGVGIPKDRMHRLFAAFSQVDASTTRQYGGTGLGLAISRRLAHLMGGTIWAESEEGIGSAFHFSIPARHGQPSSVAANEGLGRELVGRRILLVEDHSTSRELLQRRIHGWGAKLSTVGSASEAIAEVVQSDPFEIILINSTLKGVGGLELAAELRKLSRAMEAPIVLMSPAGWREHLLGDAEGPTREEVEVFATLTKPVRRVELAEVLTAAVSTEAKSGTPPSPVRRADVTLASRKPLRILVAEDNPVNQQVTLLLLEKMGYAADLAANGQEVLNAMSRQRYDVVLMDMQMPVMDGLDASRRIREEFPPARQPRIIAMTANAFAEDRDACLAAGMNEYLIKPVNLESLQDALRRCTSLSIQTSSRPMSEAIETPAVSIEALERLRSLGAGGGASVLAKVIPMLLSTGKEHVAEMTELAATGSLSEVSDIAHKFKGSVGVVGATRLAYLCGKIEKEAEAGQRQATQAVVKQAASEFRRVEKALQLEISNEPPA